MSRKRSLLISWLINSALLWLVSCLLLQKEFIVFAFGELCLAGCLGAAAFGNRRPLVILSFMHLLLVSTLALGEICLRCVPGVVGGKVANQIFSGYHGGPGGVNRYDPHLAFTLKPNIERRIYWNGYWWTHRSNAQEYRGPAEACPEVVFLGDSMIYGHGVEEHETVPGQYAALTGRTVANLGQYATCLVQMERRYRTIAAAWQPRVVVVCCHINDITDARAWYPEEELRRYLATEPDKSVALRTRLYDPARPWWRVDRHWSSHLVPHLYFPRALNALARHLRPQEQEVVAAADAPAPANTAVPTGEEASTPFESQEAEFVPEDPLGWQVHCHALARLNKLVRQQNARLVVVDIGYPAAFSRAIEEIAKRLGATYVPAGRVVTRRTEAGEGLALPGDGHWSPLGCQVMASEIASALDR